MIFIKNKLFICPLHYRFKYTQECQQSVNIKLNYNLENSKLLYMALKAVTVWFPPNVSEYLIVGDKYLQSESDIYSSYASIVKKCPYLIKRNLKLTDPRLNRHSSVLSWNVATYLQKEKVWS